jgi:hypothetical protein
MILYDITMIVFNFILDITNELIEIHTLEMFNKKNILNT